MRRELVRYPEIFPGVDMVCRNDSRFKDEFIFSAPEFARNIICCLKSNGLELSAEENGAIVAFDTDGKKIYSIPAPTLTDSEGQEGMVRVSLEETEDGYRLIYEPDPEFMESAAYPVVLDPYNRTYNQDFAIDDTYVCSKFPNNNPSLQEVNSQYDVLRRPTKTSTMLNGQEVKTESTYDAQKGYLTTVKHNTTTAASGDVTYTFGYHKHGMILLPGHRKRGRTLLFGLHRRGMMFLLG